MLAVCFMIAMLISIVGYFSGKRFGDWILLLVLPLWLWMQYLDHIRFLIFGTTATHAAQYYEIHNYLYLVPKLENRIVPDAFHMIMDLLCIIILVLVMIRLIYRKYKFPVSS